MLIISPSNCIFTVFCDTIQFGYVSKINSSAKKGPDFAAF